MFWNIIMLIKTLKVMVTTRFIREVAHIYQM